MAASIQDQDEIISAINVTPLVDVVLVILIIFIVTAPMLMQKSIPMTLPRAASAEAGAQGLIDIRIDRAGALYIEGKVQKLEDLAAIVASKKDLLKDPVRQPSALISADVGTNYGTFAAVVDRLRIAGVSDISLNTEPTANTEPTDSEPARAKR